MISIQHHNGVLQHQKSTPFWSIPKTHHFGATGAMKSGDILKELREARGLSRPKLGAAMGTSGQQIEKLENGDRRMSEKWIHLAAGALGVPASTLVGDEPEGNAIPFHLEGASTERLRRDLPIYGTALGAPRIIEGDAVEQTTLNHGEIIDYVRRPSILNHRSDVYGLYVVGSSMAPAYNEGATVFAETKRPPMIGDDVIVYLREEDEYGDVRARCVLIKRLVRRSAGYLELEQFNPALTFRIPTSEIFRYDRVMTLGDILS
ncbi:MAG: XRE family transcriptional regulator [Blastomonas fulva]|uniref:XRE family transcriptional regulator n=1 Tax=Blastomonas fulva TaxID=1550728 RepID=UPI004034EA20